MQNNSYEMNITSNKHSTYSLFLHNKNNNLDEIMYLYVTYMLITNILCVFI